AIKRKERSILLHVTKKADSSVSDDCWEVRGSLAHADRQRCDHGRSPVRGPGLHGVGRLSGYPTVVGCAGSRSGDPEGDSIDSRRADGDPGNRALLLDVFDPDSFRGLHVRILHRRPLQHRSSKFPTGRRLAGGPQARNRAGPDPSPAPAKVARELYCILPNLAQFNVKTQVVHAQPVPLGYIAVTSAYAALYIAVLLVAAVVIFSRLAFK